MTDETGRTSSQAGGCIAQARTAAGASLSNSSACTAAFQLARGAEPRRQIVGDMDDDFHACTLYFRYGSVKKADRRRRASNALQKRHSAVLRRRCLQRPARGLFGGGAGRGVGFGEDRGGLLGDAGAFEEAGVLRAP
jgi:hypothetical protein